MCPQIIDKDVKGETHDVGDEVVGHRGRGEGGKGQCPSGESPLGLIWDSEGKYAAHCLAQKVLARHITHPCNDCS